MTNFDMVQFDYSPLFTPENSWAKITIPININQRSLCAWDLLTKIVTTDCSNFYDDASVVLSYPNEGKELDINGDKEFYPGCLIKFPIMVACFQAADKKIISLDDRLVLTKDDMVGGSGILKFAPLGSSFKIRTLIENMIIYSDNIALNMIIDSIGINYINECFSNIGLDRTQLGHKLMYFGLITTDDISALGIKDTESLWKDLNTNGYIKSSGLVTELFYELGTITDMRLNESFTNRKIEIYNMVRAGLFKTGKNSITARDVVDLLKKVYSGESITPEISRKCLEIMKKNIYNELIPAGLPQGVMIAHKTGSTRTVSHDAGIVYTPRGDFIICVLTKHPEGLYSVAQNFIRSTAMKGYDYQMGLLFNPFCFR